MALLSRSSSGNVDGRAGWIGTTCSRQVSSPGALLELCQLCRHRVFCFCMLSRQVSPYKPRPLLVTKLCAAVSPFPFLFLLLGFGSAGSSLLQQAAWCVFMAVAFGAVAVPYFGHYTANMHFVPCAAC